VALVLTSASEGAGKNAFTEKLQAVVGVKEPHDLSIATADADKLFGRFNSSLSHKLLVILNEADVSGPYSAKIKGLVTDPTVEIEAKFVDPYTETSVHRFIFTSNSEKPVAAIGPLGTCRCRSLSCRCLTMWQPPRYARA
jgi:phage/plasmid-associated DNA primase